MLKAWLTPLLLCLVLLPFTLTEPAFADGYPGGQPKEEPFRRVEPKKPAKKSTSTSNKGGAVTAAPIARPQLLDGPRRLSVVIFPTLNSTGMEVWESKYYPYNILEQKMSDYLESLFKRSPLIEVRVLDEAGMNRWLAAPRRPDDMRLARSGSARS